MTARERESILKQVFLLEEKKRNGLDLKYDRFIHNILVYQILEDDCECGDE